MLGLIRLFQVGSVLLGYLVLHLVDGVFLQLLAYLLLLSFPLILYPVGAVPLILTYLLETLFFDVHGFWHELQIKKGVV